MMKVNARISTIGLAVWTHYLSVTDEES